MRRWAAICLLLVLVAPAGAQEWPTHPVTLVVPYAAGGPVDALGRILGTGLSDKLGQQITIENVGGAGGMTGSAKVAQARPDGYTMVLGTVGTHAQGQTLYKKPLYNAATDFTPVALIAEVPIVLIARKDLPANNLKELIAWLKANPNATSATIGVGSAAHMCMVYFQNETGTKFQTVPYRGAAPAMQDLLAGTIDLFCPEAGQTLPQFRAGSVKAFAVLTEKRWFAAPDVPTIDEAGVPGVHFPFWHGLWAPKGVSADVLARLNAAVVAALADPGARKRFNDLGHEVAPSEQQTPAALAAFYKAETDKWWPIIKAANIKGQ
jgi:tripartite-type tricarboxylate transporter receptor subunit TctC